MAKRQTYTVAVTGVGMVGDYPYIAKPDFGTGSFKSAHGNYKFTLIMDKEDPKCIQLMNLIDEGYEENLENLRADLNNSSAKQVRGKKPPKIEEGDKPYFDNEDGTVTFKLACHAGFTDKKTGEARKINLPVTDTKGTVLKNVPNIGANSEVKVKVQLVPYGSTAFPASIKLRPLAVMLVKLVEYGAQGDTLDWGDEEVEEGYIAQDDDTRSPVNLDEDIPFGDDEDSENGDF
ncbi:single stranded DNA binding protein [Pasteurella phage vB_PmuP_PHB02]|uniref:Single stranded DNA binding protein n=1 Tax=Pasteurella phage vB_PmuP_PHB02 TaxID=2005054 RepID=A0A1Y0T3V6_9CAUD|nr:single stranded DNA binding protein [Pasteurella phage vB_PmuP_PHB02]ARV77597.1 single stranded DNA binding protein [Pasteurella phage vB_PmuP_PHB02]